jgi:hypothetical protein
MKQCSRCSQDKPASEFYSVGTKCRTCAKEVASERYYKNREEILARLKTPEARARQREKDKQRYHNSPKRKQQQYEASVRWRINNPQRKKEVCAKWNASQRAKTLNAIRAANRRAKRKQATPTWANHYVINLLYASMEYFRKEGLDVHVDHIVPLVSDVVCGLHCHFNLRLMYADLNHQKSNKLLENL